MATLKTKQDLLKLIYDYLYKLDYKDICKKINLDTDSTIERDNEKNINKKIKELENYFEELKEHANYLKKLSIFSTNFFEEEFQIKSENIKVSSKAGAHKSFNLQQTNQDLEIIIKTANSIIYLIRSVKK